MLAMAMQSGETEPEQTGRPLPTDPRDLWSPDQIYTMLRNYKWLDGPLGSRDVERLEMFQPASVPVTVFAMYAIRCAELDAALKWLGTTDENAANAIAAYYILERPIDQIATRVDRDERTVYRWINRGVHAMARRLGWRPASERLHPFQDTEAEE